MKQDRTLRDARISSVARTPPARHYMYRKEVEHRYRSGTVLRGTSINANETRRAAHRTAQHGPLTLDKTSENSIYRYTQVETNAFPTHPENLSL